MPWKVVVVSSSGGVLRDVLALRPWLRRHLVTWVVPVAPDTAVLLRDETVHWQPDRRLRDLPWLPFDTLRALRHLRARRADCVVSAGTGLATGWFVAAALLGIPRVWIDTYNIVDRPGRVARACGRLADVVLTQHPSSHPSRRRSLTIGRLY